MEQINLGWQIDAECQNMSKDLFFTEHGKRLSQKAIDACHRCPVREACLKHALKYEEYGYWGGKTPAERKRMRKELGITLIHPQSLAEIFNIALPDSEDTRNKENNQPCGTYAAYQRHKRNGEFVDEACVDAYKEYKINLNARRRASKEESL